MEEMFDFCRDKYAAFYLARKTEMEDEAIRTSRNHTVSKDRAEKIETNAQLVAIKDTMKEGMQRYPENIPELWNTIYKAHLFRKSGISDPDVLARAISASQSWKSSSGHAFEYMAKELANKALVGTGIRFLLQRDLSEMLRFNQLANYEEDLKWLRAQVDTDNYDLFAVGTVGEDTHCFGCIQCKTSIRDRVTRDRELSATAMDKFFWSISLVIDGTQLTTPKYIKMVNGGDPDVYLKNGWHGMYDLAHTVPGGRIYDLDMDFDIIRDHAEQAFEHWCTKRQWFTNEWIAK